MNLPIHRKLGYNHMLEMREIETALKTQGISGVELHFAAVRYYEAKHKNDPSFKERQKVWLSTQSAPSRNDLLKIALEEIRDGHNDPRALAEKVLLGIKE